MEGTTIVTRRWRSLRRKIQKLEKKRRYSWSLDGAKGEALGMKEWWFWFALGRRRGDETKILGNGLDRLFVSAGQSSLQTPVLGFPVFLRFFSLFKVSFLSLSQVRPWQKQQASSLQAWQLAPPLALRKVEKAPQSRQSVMRPPPHLLLIPLHGTTAGAKQQSTVARHSRCKGC